MILARERRLIAGILCVFEGNRYIVTVNWIRNFIPGAHITFLWDTIALLFLRRVCFIARAVLAFSISYIKHEMYYGRFQLLVVVFVASMLILILRADFLTIIIGWDGLGVRSFLLVVYFQNKSSWNAGMLTLLSNRIGDIFLMLSIALLLANGGWELSHINVRLINRPFLLALFVFGACTKRAQVPFSAWLPAAIAAPTPVSALVHSSTLVTAGVYLLVRLRSALYSNSNIKILVLILGSLTIVIAGGSALFEFDLKKLVALSTLRQLGLMITRLGVGLSSLAFFHLLTHAFFKSLLFIATGRVIHSVRGGQDFRERRVNMSYMPVTRRVILLSRASLIGLPFLRGFYSKDAILEITCQDRTNVISVGFLYMGCMFTILYSIRFVVLIFKAQRRTAALVWTSDDDLILCRPSIGQVVLSVVGGAGLFHLWALDLRFIYLTRALKVLILVVTVVIGLIANKVLICAAKPSIKVLNSLGRMWGLTWLVKARGFIIKINQGVSKYREIERLYISAIFIPLDNIIRLQKFRALGRVKSARFIFSRRVIWGIRLFWL